MLRKTSISERGLKMIKKEMRNFKKIIVHNLRKTNSLHFPNLYVVPSAPYQVLFNPRISLPSKTSSVLVQQTKPSRAIHTNTLLATRHRPLSMEVIRTNRREMPISTWHRLITWWQRAWIATLYWLIRTRRMKACMKRKAIKTKLMNLWKTYLRSYSTTARNHLFWKLTTYPKTSTVPFTVPT